MYCHIKHKNIKKILKITLITLLSILLLVALAVFSLRYPAVQTYVTKQVTSYLSEQLQTEITLESVYFKPFRSLELRGFAINDRKGDALLSAKQLAARLSFAKIWNNKIVVQHITLDNASVHYEI